jgi:hypothetical protein
LPHQAAAHNRTKEVMNIEEGRGLYIGMNPKIKLWKYIPDYDNGDVRIIGIDEIASGIIHGKGGAVMAKSEPKTFNWN